MPTQADAELENGHGKVGPGPKINKFLVYFGLALIYNSVIAMVLSVFTGRFWFDFIFSQCIGLSIFMLSSLVIVSMRSGVMRWVTVVATIPIATAIGISLAQIVSGVGSWSDGNGLNRVVLGLFFGMMGVIAYLLIERIDAEVKHRQLVKAESEKREVEASLKLLQAQIEPHFLFNTLANVDSLIMSDPKLARQLLDRLNEWLRVALVRTRSRQMTLGDELEMLGNYLEILKIRFGRRLSWHMDVSDEARKMDFPPMLLQPLVENAVRHGIEPKLGGGEIIISANVTNKVLQIEVRDDGLGFAGNLEGGTGLANVRARLQALFDGAGQLSLESAPGGGVIAIMEVPR